MAWARAWRVDTIRRVGTTKQAIWLASPRLTRRAARRPGDHPQPHRRTQPHQQARADEQRHLVALPGIRERGQAK
jgi:hypothetical protein